MTTTTNTSMFITTTTAMIIVITPYCRVADILTYAYSLRELTKLQPVWDQLFLNTLYLSVFKIKTETICRGISSVSPQKKEKSIVRWTHNKSLLNFSSTMFKIVVLIRPK
jgi:hypothetical protein